ncbi:MAG TPA: hypothetical protein VGR35_09535 [Tepidisphaeraceae bacterium]|nr:hypothetical protein [Tepidisphaeraceae bacterium]
MAQLNANIRFCISPIGRAVLWTATQLARIGMPIPHPLVVAIMNRCWRMQIGAGEWRAIRIDNTGRIL